MLKVKFVGNPKTNLHLPYWEFCIPKECTFSSFSAPWSVQVNSLFKVLCCGRGISLQMILTISQWTTRAKTRVFSMETMLFLHMSNQFDLGCLVLWWIELGNLHTIERKELNKDNPCTNCSLKLGRFYPSMFLYPPIFLKAKRWFFCSFFFAGKLGSIEICQDQIQRWRVSLNQPKRGRLLRQETAGSWSKSPKLLAFM